MVSMKYIIMGVLVLAIAFMAGCNTEQTSQDVLPAQNQETTPGQQEGVETSPTDKDNTQDETSQEKITSTTGVLATVNGEEITSNQVMAIQQGSMQQGQQVSEEDAVEQAIEEKLLKQEAKEEGYSFTNEEAEAEIEKQLTQQNATLEDYKNQLETQGVSYDKQLESLKENLAVQKYLQAKFEGKDFNVTEAEKKEFYGMYKQQSSEEVPPYEQVEPQIAAAVQQQKQQEAIDELVKELREDAEIEYK